jgi:hypothetical protein
MEPGGLLTFHKSLRMDPLPNHMNLIHILKTYLFKIHCEMIHLRLHLPRVSSKQVFQQIYSCISGLSPVHCMSRPSEPPSYGHFNNISRITLIMNLLVV